ncbi:hypothetical protein [Streptomyces meridianus]|uniref:Uncharacterized protein n=1 Tax=Streptomyces meridianus TaxID=2938945 RepID=A0ABT0XE86_9ACTN|nr:hypothetical protein [Streptomyces meridianus]MCM2580263.1 hypothetical protein [Streptomyces meridianus]
MHDQVRDPDGTLRAVSTDMRTREGALLHGEDDLPDVETRLDNAALAFDAFSYTRGNGPHHAAPPIPTLDGVPVRQTLPGQSLTALTGELHELRRSADVADVLEQILAEHHGLIGDLEEFIDTAAAWCERLGTTNGRELGLHLRTIAHHIAFVGDELVSTQLDLAVMPDMTPDNAPATSSAATSAAHTSATSWRGTL